METMSWGNVARMLQEEIEVDWEDESFICPMCDEPILSDDWAYLPAELDDKGNPHPFCPICGFSFED